MRFFGIFSKTALRIFLIFCQNVELNSFFQLAKTFCEKSFIQKLFQVKDARTLIIWMIFFFTFYIFKCFDQILLALAQNIITEWFFSYNLISCSKMMGFGCNF